LQHAVKYRNSAVGPYHRARGLSEREIKKFALIESSISRWSSKRRLYATANGELACVPLETKPGDIITVLYRGDVPYVLRRMSPELQEKWHQYTKERRLGYISEGNFSPNKREEIEKRVSNSQLNKLASIEHGFVVIGECYMNGMMQGEALYDEQVKDRQFLIY
jgi:hypothetical protein